MTKTITQNDLVRFVYAETGRKENSSILDAAVELPWVNQELHLMLDAKNALDMLFEKPSPGCVESILDAVKRNTKEGI